MTIDSKIAADVQEPTLGEFVQLFELDTSVIITGGSIYRFTQSRYESAPIEFGGSTYWPIDVEIEGFEFRASGQLPQPTMRLGLIGSTGVPYSLREIIRSYGDLIGAKLTRRRTFRQYLDDQDDPDTTAQFLPEIYRIERKSRQDNMFVEFVLSSYLDIEGKLLPGRQVLRDNCTHRYRYWTGSAWNYSDATCPYTGSVYYDKDGVQVYTEAEDECGYKLSDCKLRFGSSPLPTRAFPGVSKVRILK